MTTVELALRFEQAFRAHPSISSAPGRVNLIGEHTDYNDGFVLPCAISFRTHVAVHAREDNKLIMCSGEFPGQFEFDVNALPAAHQSIWCDYPVGVAVALRNIGFRLPGANVMVQGEVPVGAGLSSSAALEVASALAFLGLSGGSLPLPQIAQLCQRAENEFVGARVGIMDQFVACLGKAGHALMLDCRSLAYEFVPIPAGVSIVICNTMVRHKLAGGEYNVRRAECEEGVRLLAKRIPGITALRDVSVAQLEKYRADLPEKIHQRCEHVVWENQRVLESSKALVIGDLTAVGEYMAASHRSLRDLYQVSCFELDLMVESAQGLPGFFGGRMTGGGFGGCTVNLVNTPDAAAFAERIASRYQERAGIHPDVFVSAASDGASVITNETMPGGG
jgi:galactokinase